MSAAGKQSEILETITIASDFSAADIQERDQHFLSSRYKAKIRIIILALVFISIITMLNLRFMDYGGRTVFSMPIYLSGVRLLDFFENNIQSIDASNKNTWHHSSFLQNSYYDNFRFFLTTLSRESLVSEAEILTRDVPVLEYVHSHNDYWRTLPLYDALLHGVNSVEADIWLVKDDKRKDSNILAVGHNTMYLNPAQKNLQTLYIEPLVEILDQINEGLNHLGGDNTLNNDDSKQLSGVFFDSPETPLILYIDFKDSSPDNLEAYEEVLRQLKPLRRYLTTQLDFEKNRFKPLVIELTGNYPRLSKYEDFIFLDSSLIQLYKKEVPFKSPVISDSFVSLINFCHGKDKDDSADLHLLKKKDFSFSDEEIICLSQLISNAHDLNYKVRIWGVPQVPVYNRENLWRQQLDVLGVDFLNIDDLDAVLKL